MISTNIQTALKTIDAVGVGRIFKEGGNSEFFSVVAKMNFLWEGQQWQNFIQPN